MNLLADGSGLAFREMLLHLNHHGTVAPGDHLGGLVNPILGEPEC